VAWSKISFVADKRGGRGGGRGKKLRKGEEREKFLPRGKTEERKGKNPQGLSRPPLWEKEEKRGGGSRPILC